MKQKLLVLLMGLVCLNVTTFAQLINHKMDNLWLPDASGNEHHIENNSCFTIPDSEDANNKILDCNNSTKVAIQAPTNSEDKYSINLWFYLNSSNKTQRIFHKGGKGGTVSAKIDYSLLYLNNQLRFQIGSNDGFAAAELWTDANSITSQTWYMVTCTYDNTTKTAKLYLNGTLAESANHSKTISPTNQPLYLSYYYSSETQEVDGYMDDVAVWDKTLTTTEIGALYTKTSVPSQVLATYNFEELLSYTEDDQTVSVSNCKIVDGIKGKAMELSNGSLNYGNINFTSHTFNIWFKPNSIGSPQRILHQDGLEDTNYTCSLLLNEEGKVEYRIGNNSGGEAINLSSESLNTNQWYLISATFDNTNNETKLYLNGNLQDEGISSNGILTTDKSLTLSYYSNEDPQYVDGSLDDISIHNTVLDAQTIADLYNNDGYSAEDKALLQQIKTQNDTSEKLDFTNEPKYWTGIEWNDESPKRVTTFSNGSKSLSGNISFEGLSELETINIRYNYNIRSINIKDLNKLTSIDITSTAITEVDLSDATDLNTLNAPSSKLTHLDISNNANLKTLYARNNYLRFSTLTVGNVNPTGTVSLNPQLPIEVAQSIDYSTSIDLSSENINNQTVYTLYDDDDNPVEASYYSVINGILSFTEELKGKTLYCSMENSAFIGDLELKTSSFNINFPYEDKEIAAPFLESFSNGQTSYDYYEHEGNFNIMYGSDWAYFNFFNTNSGKIAEITLPPINLSTLTDPVLSFQSYRTNGSYASTDDRVDVMISSDRGESWNTVWSAMGTDLSTGSGSKQPGGLDDFFQNPQIDLSNFGSSILVKFKGTSSYGTDWSFTNISINELDVDVTIDGQNIYGETLTANLSQSIDFESISYQWYRNNVAIANEIATTYTISEEDIDNELKLILKLNNQIERISNTIVPTKASTNAPNKPQASDIGSNSVTLEFINNYEYRIGENGAWTSNATFDGLTPNTEYSFYQRVAETSTNFASEASSALVITTSVASSVDDVRSGLKVYPNPTSGSINIKGAQGELIKIFTLSGEQISQQLATSELFNIDLSHLHEGIYLVKIGNSTHKVVKH